MDAGLSSSLREFLEENKCMNNKLGTLIFFFSRLAIHICVEVSS